MGLYNSLVNICYQVNCLVPGVIKRPLKSSSVCTCRNSSWRLACRGKRQRRTSYSRSYQFACGSYLYWYVFHLILILYTINCIHLRRYMTYAVLLRRKTHEKLKPKLFASFATMSNLHQNEYTIFIVTQCLQNQNCPGNVYFQTFNISINVINMF